MKIGNLNTWCHIEIVKETDTCSSDCKDGLEKTRNDLGCCVNFFNTSIGNEDDNTALAYRVWEFCGVETPAGLCHSQVRVNKISL